MTLDERQRLEFSADARDQVALERDREEWINGILRATQKAIAQGDVDQPSPQRSNLHEP